MQFIQLLERLRDRVVGFFPERHLYVRSGGDIRGYVLTTRKQLMIASGVAAASLWMGVTTAAMLINVMALSAQDQELARTQARYERWIADRQARLNSAVAQLNATSGSVDELATDIEKRHAALAFLLSDFRGDPDAAAALAPAQPVVLTSAPMDRVQAVRLDQERLIAAAETYAKTRAERMRLAFRLAGLNPDRYANDVSLGGPLIEAKDPRALAAVLDVDESFAIRIQRASSSMAEMRSLSETARKLPLARPTGTAPSSGFGMRMDPFTRRPAFHSGLDFGGGMYTPIHATAPGVVSFTGVRSGYGNTIEIDHGSGFKTRYAHLSSIGVRPGERVAVGQRIGGMGSTGRSTGPHLHYEVWVNGRAQNPGRFVQAGDELGV